MKKTRDYIETEDQNRKRKDDSMSRNTILSVIESRINAISTSRND
jgi:hypothetical protein